MNQPVVKTARRVFEILEVFSDLRRPLGLKEVAERLGYPTSSASALLKSLSELGYLDYDRFSRTYFPTMRIVELGDWVGDALFGDSPIRAQMQRLSELTQETVTLATQSDLYVQYVHVIQSPLPLSYHVPVGRNRLLAFSGLGWLLLSMRSDEKIETLTRRMNARLEGERRIDPETLMGHVRDARRDGWVFSRNVIIEGAGGLCFRAPEPRHGRRLVMGVHGPLDRIEAKRDLVIAEMRAFAERCGG